MDHFAILGIPQNASIDEIKKAYRRQAVLYHPDKNPKELDKFLLIQEAYEYLLKNYEELKKDASSRIFAEMFKAMKAPATKQKVIKVSVSLKEALLGEITKHLKILFEVPCTCSVLTQSECAKCRGIGYVAGEKEHTFTFTDIQHQNQTYAYKNFFKGTTLIVKLSIEPEGSFRIRGQTIESEEQLNIFKAILGGKHKVQTVFGEEEIELPGGSITNFSIDLPERGLAGGDQIVKFKLAVPKNLTEEQKTLLRKLL